MAAFVRQWKLENKTAENISQISEFGFVAWDFLLAIYEFGWDKLTANKDKDSFRECISVQFNRKPSNNTTLRKEDKGKQASFSRILLQP